MKTIPRVLIAATRKSSGKTTICAGLAAALDRRGLSVQTFKKGPDYIDPMWLRKLSGNPCFNLDFNTQSHEEILSLFQSKTCGADFGLVEGNKGLFDGIDMLGSDSNAAMAKLLDMPVILVVDAEGSTRGVAPLINGYLSFEPDLKIGGVILNNVCGQRHETKLRAVIEHYTDTEIIGAVKKEANLTIEERHLGLVTDREDSNAQSRDVLIATTIESEVDVDKVLSIASDTHTLPDSTRTQTLSKSKSKSGIRIGVAYDSAFCFYYQDDLDTMLEQGHSVEFFSTLEDTELPDVDALYIGGGFPETHLEQLANNRQMLQEIRRFAEDNKPIYAECGGLMYLTESITWHQKTCSMVGALPARSVMCDRPVGRGLVKLTTTVNHPWCHNPVQIDCTQVSEISAHEFHYSKLVDMDSDIKFGFDVQRGHGITGESDGIVYRNVFANYAHMRHTQSYPWISHFTAAVERQMSILTNH